MTALMEQNLDDFKTLNVGCGPIRMESAIGLDWDPDSVADVHHDLNEYPWPFKDNRFERVLLSHVLEHLEDPDLAVREVHRLYRGGGRLRS